ncbi:MAG: 8-amino-7-oxononanoate synthase [Opitutales bacterium]|jgi:8-amino-7-oxononanoate synthase
MPEPSSNSADLLRARWQPALDERAAAGRLRELRPAAPVRVNLADNDYLGLAEDPAVKNAVRAALDAGPVSASSSPLVRGYAGVHAVLESALCAWHGFPAGLVWNTGFTANQAVLGTLAAPGDLIFADRLAHHSLLAGILKSGAKFTRFPHNDLDALERLLDETAASGRVRWVVTESVYSMDGDSPDFHRLAALRRRHGFLWMLDEAHALGWYGPRGEGRAAETGVTADVDILVGTLGKALGAMGAYSLFRDPTLRGALINRSGEFIYSTYLSPLLAAAALAALERVRELAPQSENWRIQSRRFRAALQAQGWQTPFGDSPIVPVLIGEDAAVISLGRRLLERGFAVGAIRPPTVPVGTARLRLSLKSTSAWADLESLLHELDAWRRENTPISPSSAPLVYSQPLT